MKKISKSKKAIGIVLAVIIIASVFTVMLTVARQGSMKKMGDVQTAGGLVTVDLNSGPTAVDLANALMGGGVAVSNVVYTGDNVAAGTFSGGTGIIGFESGIILSSGNISYVVGPNTYSGTTGYNYMPGDTDLDALIPGYYTYDAAVLEFDFVPGSSVVTFVYVFGSEEYNEYVNSEFNDVFGFFINGVNCALIPGTSTPVAINNVNGGKPFGTDASNSNFYLNNDLYDPGPATINTELDGLTVVLTVTASVNAGETNHIKLAIADAGDYILDSDVFIKAESFVAPDLTLSPLTATNLMGDSHTLTATLVANGQAVPDETITFNVTEGPNVGLTGTGVTDSTGNATWSYVGSVSGTDTIVATSTGETSNKAYKTWKSEVYFVPQGSTAPYGSGTEVKIWVNAAEFKSGQINMTYDPTCANVTNYAWNTTNFPVSGWTHHDGSEWITFMAEATSLSGTYEIGTLTIQCVNEVECTTALEFNVTDSSEYCALFGPYSGEIVTNWKDGTFGCGGDRSGDGLCGDVNCDGKVNMGDVGLLHNHVQYGYTLNCC